MFLWDYLQRSEGGRTDYLTITLDKLQQGFDDFYDIDDEHCKDDQDNEDDKGA